MSRVIIVNVITSLRIVFSILFAYNIIVYSDNIIAIVILCIMICATDFFDGRMARRLMACTKAGAIFDVMADLFFITITYSALIIQNIVPIWLVVIVLLKFLEFCVTSFIAKKMGKCQNSVFLFDILGRIVAIFFFAIPVLAIILKHYVSPQYFYLVIDILGYSIATMACISSFYRVKICLWPVRFKRNYGIVKEEI